MMRTLSWYVMAVLAIGTAGYAMLSLTIPSFRSGFIQNLFLVSPTATTVHLAGGFVAMVVGAFQLNTWLRQRFISAHRWFGRLYVVAVVCSGIAGFDLALDSYGGITSQFGFGMMATCWLATTLMAFWHIRRGNVQGHKDWMLRSYGLTLAGVTLRVYLGLGVAMGGTFSEFYPVLSWLCWVPNLLIVEWFFVNWSKQKRPASVPVHQ